MVRAPLTGIVVSSGELLKPPGVVSFSNDVGGTAVLPEGRYRVTIIHGFTDEETGRVLHGRLMDPKQIEVARQAGRVHQEGWKVAKLPDGHAKTAIETRRVFDPSLVMFNASGRGVWFPGAES